MRHRTVTVRWRGTFPVPVDELWQLFSDTDRLDQAVGVPATNFHPTNLSEGRVGLAAQATYLGILFQWTELPYEWSAGRWFQVERAFSRAPLVRRVRTSASFRALAAGMTEVEVVADFV
ncbi:MAG: hypothetical protein M3437_07050, partial [Chloroflexota bacterium]|nr:hypothetical protein [Chloroflexota bacterium]